MSKVKSAIRRWLLRRLIPEGVMVTHLTDRSKSKFSLLVAIDTYKYEDTVNFEPFPTKTTTVSVTAKGIPYTL